MTNSRTHRDGFTVPRPRRRHGMAEHRNLPRTMPLFFCGMVFSTLDDPTETYQAVSLPIRTIHHPGRRLLHCNFPPFKKEAPFKSCRPSSSFPPTSTISGCALHVPTHYPAREEETPKSNQPLPLPYSHEKAHLANVTATPSHPANQQPDPIISIPPLPPSNVISCLLSPSHITEIRGLPPPKKKPRRPESSSSRAPAVAAAFFFFAGPPYIMRQLSPARRDAVSVLMEKM